MGELREQPGIAARALEFLILTACRAASEVANATWSEIDLDAKIWTIPASRMKASRDHRVPLSDPAIALLKGLRQFAGEDNTHVFVSPRRAGAPIGTLTLLKVLDRVREGFTVHGFRSTFRDWAGERTNFDRITTELALAHKAGDATELAYRRGDALEKRRRLMDAWSYRYGRCNRYDERTGQGYRTGETRPAAR